VWKEEKGRGVVVWKEEMGRGGVWCGGRKSDAGTPRGKRRKKKEKEGGRVRGNEE
jgi:hypothetical protein